MATQLCYVDGVELQVTMKVVLVGASAVDTASRLAVALQDSDADGKLAAVLRDLAKAPGATVAPIVKISVFGEV